MRTKLNLDGSNRRVAERLEIPGLAAPPDIPSHIPQTQMPPAQMPPAQMPPAQMPMEWLDAGNWRLPSGKALAEFALQAGFLAPLLFKAERFGRTLRNAPGELSGASGARGKQFG